MASREILVLGNPVLWTESVRVQPEELRATKTDSLIRDLSDTLAAFREGHGFGRGIAAPQIGVLSRIIFIRMQPSGFCGPLINPVIEWASDEQVELWDDCFSLPDLMVRVRRSVDVRVRYLDVDGTEKLLTAEKDLSELLQHEIDHLDGVLATDRAVSPRAISTRSEWEKARKDQL